MSKFKQLVIGLVIAGAAIYFTIRNVSMEQLWETFETVEYIYLIPVVLLALFSYVARAYRWRVLLSCLKPMRVSEVYSPLMVGFMGNILPGRAGEVLRAYLMSQKQDIPFTGTFATIVVERLFDLVFLLILFVWVFVFHAEIFDSDAVFSGVGIRDLAYRFGQFSALVVVGLVVFIYFLMCHRRKVVTFFHWVVTPLPKKWKHKVEHLIETFAQGLEVARSFSTLVKIAFFSALVWAGIVGSFYPLYWAFPIEDRSLDSVLVLTVMVCVMITLIPTPAFLGSYNAGVLIALHEIMRETEVIAVSLGMVSWALNFLVLVVAGVWFLVHEHLSVKTLVDLEKEGEKVLDEAE